MRAVADRPAPRSVPGPRVLRRRPTGGAPRVAIAYKSLPAYRVDFFDALRIALACDGVELILVHGDPVGDDRSKRDAASLPWAIHRANRAITVRGRALVWQPVAELVASADLVVVEQASKLLVNYALLLRQAAGFGPKVAFWGHGANLNPRTRSGPSERAKRRYSTRAHWWFAYTEGSRNRVERLGYPGERITVVQNAADTESLQNQLAGLADDSVAAFRERFGATAGATGLFIGSLYEDKRLRFLLDASRLVHEANPGFVLLIAGDGPAKGELLQHSRDLPWVHWLGRVDAQERLCALAAADCVLMPGLVGLAILDAFAAEAPLVTTDLECHSPEIEYLRDGDNGLIVGHSDDPRAYADTVLRLLTDDALRGRLQRGCRDAAATYTTAAMVERFRAGLLAALGRG